MQRPVALILSPLVVICLPLGYLIGVAIAIEVNLYRLLNLSLFAPVPLVRGGGWISCSGMFDVAPSCLRATPTALRVL